MKKKSINKIDWRKIIKVRKEDSSFHFSSLGIDFMIRALIHVQDEHSEVSLFNPEKAPQKWIISWVWWDLFSCFTSDFVFIMCLHRSVQKVCENSNLLFILSLRILLYFFKKKVFWMGTVPTKKSDNYYSSLNALTSKRLEGPEP